MGVLYAESVGGCAVEVDGEGVGFGRIIEPGCVGGAGSATAGHDALAVEVDVNLFCAVAGVAVIFVEVEGVVAGVCGADGSGPTDRIDSGGGAWDGCCTLPTEVELLIDTCEDRGAGEVGGGEVLCLEAVLGGSGAGVEDASWDGNR